MLNWQQKRLERTAPLDKERVPNAAMQGILAFAALAPDVLLSSSFTTLSLLERREGDLSHTVM